LGDAERRRYGEERWDDAHVDSGLDTDTGEIEIGASSMDIVKETQAD
jgi:hypothetical protein